MTDYWVSIDGAEGVYIEAESMQQAVAWATFMRAEPETLTIESGTRHGD